MLSLNFDKKQKKKSTEIMNKQAMFDQEKPVFRIASRAESSYENFPDWLPICVKGE